MLPFPAYYSRGFISWASFSSNFSPFIQAPNSTTTGRMEICRGGATGIHPHAQCVAASKKRVRQRVSLPQSCPKASPRTVPNPTTLFSGMARVTSTISSLAEPGRVEQTCWKENLLQNGKYTAGQLFLKKGRHLLPLCSQPHNQAARDFCGLTARRKSSYRPAIRTFGVSGAVPSAIK